MMATTHMLAGMALASVTLVLAPEQAPVAVAAAAAGGAFPDLDLYAGHRRTLHYPVYYPMAAALAVGLAAVVTTPVTVGVAAFLAAAALHATMDALGGGLELRPWESRSERAVYDHFNGRWIAPRRWVRYDGAPEDVLLAAGLAAPTLALAPEPLTGVALVALLVSGSYALVRKPMAAAVERLVPRLPSRLVARLPERFRDGVGA